MASGSALSDTTAPRPGFTLVASPAACTRLAAARDFLSAHSSTSERLLVGDTREAADELARSLVSDTGAVFGLHRFSLHQLAAHLSGPALAERGLAVASGLGAEAVAARSAFDALAD